MNFFENTPKSRKTNDLKIRVIGSSSEGNCIFIQHGNDKILIDAGISRKRVIESLSEIGCTLDEINGIFITHAHSDHIKHLEMLLKDRFIPVFATKSTFNQSKFPRRGTHDFIPIKPNQINQLNSLQIIAVSSSHDCAGSVVYFVGNKKKQIGVITDLGMISNNIAEQIRRSQLIMLETNYDENMLTKGAYPYFLKKRILSDKGHLSNDYSAEFLSCFKPRNLHTVLCSHISKDNNTPELAKDTLVHRIKSDRVMNSVKVELTHRQKPTEFFTA